MTGISRIRNAPGDGRRDVRRSARRGLAQQCRNTVHEGRGWLPTGQLHPLYLAKALGYRRLALYDVVDDHGYQKWLVLGHIPHAINGSGPFPPEVALVARLGSLGNDGYEQPAFANLVVDLAVPVL